MYRATVITYVYSFFVIIILLYFYRRNLEYFDACHFEAVASCDMEWSLGNGELVIKVPKEIYDSTPGNDGIRMYCGYSNCVIQ